MIVRNGEIWLNSNDLTQIGISKATIKAGIGRNSPKWQTMKDHTYQRKNLIRFATMAEKYRDLVIAKICEGKEPLQWFKENKGNTEKQKCVSDKCLIYDKLNEACLPLLYTYEDSSYIYSSMGITGIKLRVLCMGAAVLDVLINWYAEKQLSYSDYSPVNLACEWLNCKGNLFFTKKSLPSNPIRLMEKLRAYAVTPKPLNELVLIRTPSVIVKREKWWHQTAIYLFYQDKNRTQASILRELKAISVVKGEGCPEKKTLRLFLQKNAGLKQIKYRIQHENNE